MLIISLKIMKMNNPKIITVLSAITLSLGTLVALSACDTRTPGEKVSDGVEQVGEGKVSEGLKDVGEGLEDTTKKE